MAISMRTLSDLVYIKGGINVIGLIDLDNDWVFGVNISPQNYCYRYFNIIDVVMKRSNDCFFCKYPEMDTYNIPAYRVRNILNCTDIQPEAIECINNQESNAGLLKISFKHMKSKGEFVLTEKEANRLHSNITDFNGTNHIIKKKKAKIIVSKSTDLNGNEFEPEDVNKFYVDEMKYEFSLDRSKNPMINRSMEPLPKIYGKHGYSASGFWDFIVTGVPWQ